MDEFQFLPPWWSTASQSNEFHDTFEKQLRIEIPPGHPLEDKPVRCIARGDGDDVLFEILDGSGCVAYVHLTWQSVRQEDPWPLTKVFSSLAQFADDIMIPENRERRQHQ